MAQTARQQVEADCGAIALPVAAAHHDAWGAFLPGVRWQRLVADSVPLRQRLDSVRSYAASVAALAGVPVRGEVRRALDSLGAELARSERGWRSNGTPTRFSAQLFEADPPSPVDMSDARFTWMVGTSFTITVDGSMPSEQRRAICWPLQLARTLANAAGSAGRAWTILELKGIRERWKNFHDSYSMLPHELLLNDIVSRALSARQPAIYSLNPPRVQVILLHPTVGYQLKPVATSGGVGSEALVLDWGGLLYYTESRAAYAGASFFTSYPARAGELSRAGIMVAYSPLGRAGVLLPKRGEGWKRVGVMLNVDAYKFFPGAKKVLDKREQQAERRQDACTAGSAGCE